MHLVTAMFKITKLNHKQFKTYSSSTCELITIICMAVEVKVGLVANSLMIKQA